MTEVVVGKDMGAHHGDPALFERDIKVISDLILWMRVARDENKNGFHKRDGYGDDWFPSYADCLKSRLFWRIRAGKPILRHAPPTAMSCPWYELIEDDRPHWVYDEPIVYNEVFGKTQDPPLVSVSGSSWFKLVEKKDDTHLVVGFAPWTFDMWKAPNDVPAYDPVAKQGYTKTIEGWWIQRRVEPGEQLYLEVGPTNLNGYFPAFQR